MKHHLLPLLLAGALGTGAFAQAPSDTAPAALRGRPGIVGLGAARHVVIPQTRSFSLERATDEAVVIESVEAHVWIREEAARTALDIALRNTSGHDDEAVLLLPVPDGAVLASFAFEGAGGAPSAELLPADEARRLYDAIVSRLLDPALVEFAGYNLIRSSVFPVPAGGTQRIRLVYEQLLPADGDRVDYVLPRSESLGGARPWAIQVEIESQHPISTVYSPSHAIVRERRSAGHLLVTLADTPAEPGTFRLSYLRDRGDGVTASLFAYPDDEVGGGYFLLVAGLPAEIARSAPRLRREVTLVIDRSGSMAGAKMDQVRAAALQVLEGLDDGEAFNIIDYSSTVASFAPAPVVKDRTATLDARAYLAAIRPSGGTNIHGALRKALAQPPRDGMLPIVLFLTDGLPTIGRTSEVEIRDLVTEQNPQRRRVFTFGVGTDVNVPLLDRMADASRAIATYVLPEEDVEVKVARVFKRLRGPVFAFPALTTLDTSGDETTRRLGELIPGELPDLFEDDQLILLGQYRGDDPVTFSFRGNYLGAPRAFEFTFGFDDAKTTNAFVPRLWASRRIAFLIDQIRQAGAESALRPAVVGRSTLDDARSQELVDEIMRLSTRFGILTEYTAFLATEGTDLANWSDLKLGCARELEQKAVRTRAGLAAVNQAMNYQEQKGQTALNISNRFVDARLAPVEFTAVQQFADRAFFRRGNRWIDSRLIGREELVEPAEVIVIGTDAHRVLLRRLVREGRQGVLSLAGEIMLVVDGRIVLVTDRC